ncbi:MAG: glutamate-cysteine ligase family protein [Deltaproteobacteria bacterium]|nr:glutamate-cysteine ligase family protein [Deltaproteobacteria bacterium]
MARTSSLIGLEAEKFGIRSDGTPLHFRDVVAIMAELRSRFGWTAVSESDEVPLIALTRANASITLEPGSQFELSGAPLPDVHAVAAEVQQHREELASLESAKNVHWIGLGYHPTARDSDLDWVPKGRYPIMQRYLPTQGSRGLLMMRRTATVQANFDYRSERDAIKKLQVSLALSPIVQAIFANSRLAEGKLTDLASNRAWVWLDVANSRAGLLPKMWNPDATLGDYIAWAQDVPMFLLKRGGTVKQATDYTFRRFMAEGIEGEHATLSDWETHLNTLFPEVRLKSTLEVRSADGVPAHFGNALPAIFAGILYDQEALDAAHARFFSLGYEAFESARADIASNALQAKIAGQSVQSLAVELLSLARSGLKRRDIRNAQDQDEGIFLDPIEALVNDGQCVGDSLLDGINDDPRKLLSEVISRASY